MADELHFYGTPSTQSGLTVIARVYDGTGTQVGSDVSCTEVGSLALYTGDMPTASAGQYGIRFFESGGTDPLSTGYIDWDGTAEVTLATIAAQISALNNFDPASDTVANVTLVGTTTTNTDMRGTDSANTVAPDNASISAILADTNELQTNAAAGQYDTATGFATTAELTQTETDIIAALPSGSDATLAQQTAILSAIGGLNDFDPANDTVARVTLVDTTTANTDMRGTNNAFLAASFVTPPTASEIYTEFTTGANEDAFKADVSGITIDAAAIYTYFTDSNREDAFKADVSGISATVDLSPVTAAIAALNDFDPANDTVARVTLVDTTTTNTDMRGTNSAFLAASFVTPPTASAIYAEFVSGANEDVFKANVSNLGQTAPSVEWR
ncbi:MAG: hypothetical protein AAFZ74_02125 [Pseudomonadota bacterium]